MSFLQVLTLDRSILINANSQLLFKSRLGLAASDEVARVQVSLDQGKSWQNIYSQPGTLGEFLGARNSFRFGSWRDEALPKLGEGWRVRTLKRAEARAPFRWRLGVFAP